VNAERRKALDPIFQFAKIVGMTITTVEIDPVTGAEVVEHIDPNEETQEQDNGKTQE
jgi:hypothetical protein